MNYQKKLLFCNEKCTDNHYDNTDGKTESHMMNQSGLSIKFSQCLYGAQGHTHKDAKIMQWTLIT